MSNKKAFGICALLFCFWAFWAYKNELDKINELAKSSAPISAEDMLLLWKRDSIYKVADKNGDITVKGEIWYSGSTRRVPFYLAVGPREKDPGGYIVCGLDPSLSHRFTSKDEGREIIIRGRYTGEENPVNGGRFYLSNCQIVQVLPVPLVAP